MIGLQVFRHIPTPFEINGPVLSFLTQPSSVSISDAGTHTGNISPLVQVTYNGYPVRGYLYYPTSSNTGQSLDVVVLYHGTITDQGVSPADAASTFLSIALNRINLKDKLIFSVAYPQDAIPLWEANPALPAQQFPGLNYPTFYLGDNIVYAEAALLWVKNSLNSFLSSNGISKTINKVYTFGHSQGAYLVHRLNTMHAVDGVISNAPGPIDLLSRCSGAENTTNLTCNKIRVGFGTTTANPEAYNTRSLKNYLSGTLSPTLFTQALDDTTGNSFGSPQVANMQNVVQVGLSTCTNCAATTFNYYATGGHDSFVTNTYLQRDIRSFVGAIGAGIATFVGIATAEFPSQTPPNPAINSGSISYRWYLNGVGALSDGTFSGITVVGSASTTLTLSGLSNPRDTGRQIYLRADYNSSLATPNAVNDPLDSDIVTITVRPTISITSQPVTSTVAQGRSTTFSVTATTSDGSDSSLTYQWYLNGTPLTNGGDISGANSNTLTISLPNVSTNSVYVEVRHPSAGNSPFTSTSVTYGVVSARSILNYELLDDGAREFGFGNVNLFDQPITLTANASTFQRNLVVYAPEKDIKVKITMAAAAGASRNGNRGGEGGLSIFTLTLRQNQEYIFKLGAQTAPSGGANGGGGGSFFYRKGQLLVCLGGGGGAGNQGRGGDGGGVGIAGENGFGRSAGSGGTLFSVGTLPVQGFFPGGSTTTNSTTAPTGGRLAACTIGRYWANQGVAPCNDVGITQFRGGDGQTANSSATILRGYKSGNAYRNNGGNGSGGNGGGGAGTVGGNAGTGGDSGGGGGSGYSNGEVTVLNTRLGGNSSTESYVKIEYLP